VRRFMTLAMFEIRKVFVRKKAILFLLALNVIPILSGLLSLLIYVKFKGWGLGTMQLTPLVEMMRALFAGHIKLFAWISPFFLALVIGDSISGESGAGHLKTLLLTPVHRWQVLVAKGVAVLCFLLLAVMVGGLFLQGTLWVARAITDSPSIIRDLPAEPTAHFPEVSTTLVSTKAALRLLVMTFAANLAMVSFFILLALLSDSAIMSAFLSLTILMSMQSYVLMAPFLARLDDRFGTVAEWCFTRHLSQLFDLSTIQGILERGQALTEAAIWNPMIAGLGWAAAFFALAMFYFSRRPIPN
jgi:ABC-type transport system involved in multi-copper enzyme maturation permease subunit